jgi:hypothetical protein
VTQSGVRALAFTFAAAGSAVLDTLVTGGLVQRSLAPFGARSVSIALMLMRGLQVGTLYLIFESGFLRFWARYILGQWGYKSSSGNFGLAIISLAHGEFRYRVQLYGKAGEVAAAMEGNSFVLPIAHVNSKLCKYENETFETDYHIDYTDGKYPKRKGLLTLLPTTDRMVRTGNWETMYEGATLRTGRLDFRRPASFIRKYVQQESSEDIPGPATVPTTPGA